MWKEQLGSRNLNPWIWNWSVYGSYRNGPSSLSRLFSGLFQDLSERCYTNIVVMWLKARLVFCLYALARYDNVHGHVHILRRVWYVAGIRFHRCGFAISRFVLRRIVFKWWVETCGKIRRIPDVQIPLLYPLGLPKWPHFGSKSFRMRFQRTLEKASDEDSASKPNKEAAECISRSHARQSCTWQCL